MSNTNGVKPTLGSSTNLQQTAKNPFLQESINQRVAFPETPVFDQSLQNTGNFQHKISNVSGKALQEENKKSIYDVVMEQAYHIITKF